MYVCVCMCMCMCCVCVHVWCTYDKNELERESWYKGAGAVGGGIEEYTCYKYSAHEKNFQNV